MNKILVVSLFLGLLLVSCVSAYICIDLQNDNPSVIEFKNKINQLSYKSDIEKGMSPEAIKIKLKYFSPCNK